MILEVFSNLGDSFTFVSRKNMSNWKASNFKVPSSNWKLYLFLIVVFPTNGGLLWENKDKTYFDALFFLVIREVHFIT